MKRLCLVIVLAALSASEASACWLFGCGRQQQSCGQRCGSPLYFQNLGCKPNQYSPCPGGVCPAPTPPADSVPRAVPKELPKIAPKELPKELKVGNDGSAERPYTREEFAAKYGYDPFDGKSAVASTAPASGVVEELLRLHNDVRAKAGLQPLTLDASLTASAESWSSQQARSGRMGHGGGGYSAQNVAWNQQSASQVTGDWVRSPGHYRNIVGPYTRVGFGMVQGASGPYWTANFGN